jgi:hypothetical protein
MHQAFFQELAAERIRELSAEARRQRLAVALFRWGSRLADEVGPRPKLVEVRGVDGHVYHR